jgi:hypothetical protein
LYHVYSAQKATKSLSIYWHTIIVFVELKMVHVHVLCMHELNLIHKNDKTTIMTKFRILLFITMLVTLTAISSQSIAQIHREVRNNAMQYDNTRNPNYGWLGLLGLIGLLGFIKRNNPIKETPEANHTKYNS